MTLYKRTTPDARALFAFVILCGVVSGQFLLRGQTVPQAAEHACSTMLLEEPEGCVVTLPPGQTKNLSLAVPQGQVRMLTAEQVQGAVELRLPDAATRSASSDTLQPFLD